MPTNSQSIKFIALIMFSVFVACGCANEKLTCVESEDAFQTQVLQSDKPILVDFYKGGCPPCVALEPGLAQLAREYDGRVNFARFELMAPYFAVRSEQLMKEYQIKWFPTVILFVDGKERQRWVSDFDLDSYRAVMDSALATQGQRPVAAARKNMPAGKYYCTPTGCHLADDSNDSIVDSTDVADKILWSQQSK